ncbi:hypothetical protein ACF0H5_008828 [Mactra antiquata]
MPDIFTNTCKLYIFQGKNYLSRKRETYGEVYKTHILGSPTIRIIGHKNVKQVLRGENTIVQAKWPASTFMLLGEGSLSQTTGYFHRIRKKAITKAFTFDAMSRYLPMIQDVSRKYIRDWCEKQKVMGHHALKTMNFDLACRLLLGFCGSDEECKQLADIFEDFTANIFSIPIKIKGFGFSKALTARQKLLQKIDDIIENRDISNDGLDVLSSILKAQGSENLSVNDVKNLCLELLFAGHETTTSATCSLAFYLAKNPEIVRKLKDEFEKFGVEKKTDVNLQELNQLNYLNNVIKEVLRISPPIGGGFRKALKTFEINGYQVPKGWTVAYAIRDTQETSVVFDDAEIFNPDRWDSVSSLKSQFHFIPFGGGKRVCVGKDLAKLILKTFAFELVVGCKWTLENEGTRFTNFPVPTPVDGLPLRFSSIH